MGKRKRKTISKRTRFAVFERDGFQCKYCGRTSEETTLELDHVHPHSSGGDDSKENLLTSCADCNAGKRDKVLDVMPEGAALHLAQERRELQAAFQAKQEIARLREEADAMLYHAMCDELATERIPKSTFRIARRLESEFGIDHLLEWIQIAQRKAGIWDRTRFDRYLCGIARKVREDAP